MTLILKRTNTGNWGLFDRTIKQHEYKSHACCACPHCKGCKDVLNYTTTTEMTTLFLNADREYVLWWAAKYMKNVKVVDSLGKPVTLPTLEEEEGSPND